MVGQYLEDAHQEVDSNLVRAFHLLYAYMSFNSMHYGIMTTYKQACFFRGKDDSVIAVSNSTPLQGIAELSVYQCWLYVCLQSHQEGFTIG
jgi:hypothetical protein